MAMIAASMTGGFVKSMEDALGLLHEHELENNVQYAIFQLRPIIERFW
jgi:hypothetical protein